MIAGGLPVVVVGAAPAQAVPVSLKRALLVDVFSSVNVSEFGLQRTGCVNAFDAIAANWSPTTYL